MRLFLSADGDFRMNKDIKTVPAIAVRTGKKLFVHVVVSAETNYKREN